MRRAFSVCLLSAVAGVACNKGPDGSDGKTTVATAPSSASATTTSAASASTMAAASATPSPKLAPGRSAVPTLDEWSSQKKEVTVKGSSALKCETKIVREYLRVSCKGDLDPEGAPTGIKLVKGGGGALTFASGGVMSLILPYVEGTDFEGVFSWTKKSHKLVVSWPKGSKQPSIVGTFEGAASPLDATAHGDNAKLCACHMKVTHAKSCEEVYGGASADCDRTYGDDCEKLLACARGDRSAQPRCLPGYLNGDFGRCGKRCGTGQPCPGGGTCYFMFDDADVGVCAPD